MTFLASIPPGLWALIGTIIGTVGLKLLEKWLNKHVEVRDDRRDYREEIRDLNERLDKEEVQSDEWRQKFYKSQEEVVRLRALLITHGIEPPVPQA